MRALICHRDVTFVRLTNPAGDASLRQHPFGRQIAQPKVGIPVPTSERSIRFFARARAPRPRRRQPGRYFWSATVLPGHHTTAPVLATGVNEHHRRSSTGQRSSTRPPPRCGDGVLIQPPGWRNKNAPSMVIFYVSSRRCAAVSEGVPASVAQTGRRPAVEMPGSPVVRRVPLTACARELEQRRRATAGRTAEA